MILNGEYPVYGANGIIGKYHSYNHDGRQILMTCRGATCGSVNISLGKCWINGNTMVMQPDLHISDFDFMLYLCIWLGKNNDIICGSAQPQITRQTLQQLEIPIPPLHEQQRIVEKIENLYSCIDAIEEYLDT